MHQEMRLFLNALLEKSGDLIRGYYERESVSVEFKEDKSPVTAADREAELVMRDLIQKRFPSHGVIGEEFGRENDQAEYVWVLDPIDGTVSFMHQCPLFGTLVGLLYQGRPVLGAIHQPVLRETCVGFDGQCTFNNRAVHVRPTSELSASTMLATDLEKIAKHKNYEHFDALRKKSRVFRMWGDCYGYMMLASGRADIMLDPVMAPWDVIPLIPIIEGAGGVITTWEGGDACTGNSCVAANKTLHPHVLAALQANTHPLLN